MDQLKYWEHDITTIANAYKVDVGLVMGHVWVESRGQADAFRHEPNFWLRYLARVPEWKGANPRRVSSSYGLMQILYVTAKEMGYAGEPEGLFLPRENLHWGVKRIRQNLDWADGWPLVPAKDRLMAAIAAYNGGRGGNTPGTPLRNQQYALKVVAAMNHLKEIAG